jgi:DNA-binding beta-propeller fold protein YncE
MEHKRDTRSSCSSPAASRHAWVTLGRVFAIVTMGLLLLPVPASANSSASFLFPLANFAGPVRSQWAKLAVDPERNEVYALSQAENDVRIFDEHGMEVYAFEGFFASMDITAGHDGDILILTQRYDGSTIHRCNYRGEELEEITLANVPDAFSDMAPDRLVYRNGTLYLADSEHMTVIEADLDGSFIRGHDLKALLWDLSNADEDEKAARKLDEIDIGGFDVDADGKILFTVAPLFSAFRLAPDGDLEPFGRPGSGKGKFGVAAGIAAADTGEILVSDKLRSVVLVFADDLTFTAEFGYRGNRPSNLIAPDDVAIDANGHVYVAQARNLGVSVFRMARDDRSPDRPSSEIDDNSQAVDAPPNFVEEEGQ